MTDAPTAQQAPNKSPKPWKPRRQMPKKGSKTEAILTLTTTTPATPTEIAETVDCSISNVSHVLKRYGLTANATESFKKHRADVLAGMQERLLASVKEEDIKKAPLGSRVLAAAQLYDKERLERGQSTDNVAVVLFQMPEPDGVPVEGMTGGPESVAVDN